MRLQVRAPSQVPSLQRIVSMSEFLSHLLLVVYVSSTAGILWFMVSYLLQLRRHCALGPVGWAAEQRLLATALPGDAELPHVVVQIVSFNEGELVRRALQAAARLDWPRDRLHIQLLDDSTDHTPAIARAVVADLAAGGLDVVLLHRDDRDGFKAGALAGGMAAASAHEYFAIFDTDYVPAPDFLRRCMVALLADPDRAFVQARIDYLNADESALTRVQALMLDHHMSVDQMTRSWAGHPLPFNGTCGIWRRAAVEAAGGWRGDTLAEDLDLSYRAWMLGRNGRFLSSVSARGELPASLEAWANQQHRWATGFGQVARRILPLLMTARVPGFRRKLSAFQHLGPAITGPFVAVANISFIALLMLRPDWTLPLVATTVLLLVVGLLAHVLGLAVGQIAVRGPLLRRGFMAQCVHAMALQLLVAWLMTYRSLRQAIRRQHVVFARTPKRGAIHGAGPDQLV
jgi:cellulose synthase/poly-beta-1,6-N-acetylglucosamine synthase-like glycosyltransferase